MVIVTQRSLSVLMYAAHTVKRLPEDVSFWTNDIREVYLSINLPNAVSKPIAFILVLSTHPVHPHSKHQAHLPDRVCTNNFFKHLSTELTFHQGRS